MYLAVGKRKEYSELSVLDFVYLLLFFSALNDHFRRSYYRDYKINAHYYQQKQCKISWKTAFKTAEITSV